MSITITNVGPISKLSIPVPESGGVVVLRGGQGQGKSTALRAIQRSLGGKPVGLSVKDAAPRGSVEFGACKLTVTKSRTAARGELEVDSIEGKFDVSALVDPGINDEGKADAQRIKALVALSGATATLNDFKDVLPPEVTWHQLALDTDTDDPLVLAMRIKRALEKIARDKETVAKECRANAKAASDAAGDIPPNVVFEEHVLSAAHLSAVEVLASLKTKKSQQEENRETYEAAKTKLDELTSGFDVPTVEESEKNLEQARDVLGNANDNLSKAQAAVDAAMEQFKNADAALTRSKEYAEQLEAHREVVDSFSESKPVTQEKIDEAKAVVDEASAAIVKGSEIRAAMKQKDTAKREADLAKEYESQAESVRNAARATDDVLGGLIPTGRLKIEAGRLVCSTDRSDSELFSDLSEGERWKLAIDIGAEQLSESGVLVIPQVAWEGLTESSREEMDEHAKERGVVILTAEAVDGPLEAAAV